MHASTIVFTSRGRQVHVNPKAPADSHEFSLYMCAGTMHQASQGPNYLLYIAQASVFTSDQPVCMILGVRH